MKLVALPFNFDYRMKRNFILLLFMFTSLSVWAQRNELNSGVLKGVVRDALTNETLPGVSVSIQGLTGGISTDTAGFYQFKNIKPGFYNVQFSFVGYQKLIQYDIQISNAKPTLLDVNLQAEAASLGEVRISAPLFIKPVESPVSLRTIGSTEIKRNPGGNRDISKVIQSLPGVATQVSFRNDIIIRGGAPSENRYYLDGVEIPTINHFATQGASGGPVGLINVDYIREVDFYSGAFPANRGNSLSSVLEFRQRDARDDRFASTLTVGSSDFAATLEGPINQKTTFLSSYRYSYLQGLFKVLGLPFLPAYQDFQFKLKHKIDAKNEISILGLGAIDRFTLNFSADPTESNQYILSYVPVNSQDNYTIGAVYRNYRDKGNSMLVLSRNYYNKRADKFQDNDESKIKLLDYNSTEVENKLRFENNSLVGPYKINFGAGVETGSYSTATVQVVPPTPEIYNSAISLVKYGFFGQLSRSYFADRMNVSFGIRADANNYSDRMNDLFKTLSPRLSASYNLTEKFSLNANAGIYYQLPAYTVLGYRPDTDGPLTNKNVDYIRSKQLVFGLEYNTLENTRFTIESFYKFYDRYPMVRVLGDDISLANLGADFGVVGNRQVTGFSEGRSYGLEFLAQKRLKKGFYGIASFTFFRSEFQDKNKSYVPSSWNSRYIVSMTGGRIFNRNWELGARFRLSGGSPYTPLDLAASSLKTTYDIFPRGIPDYDRLNAIYLDTFYQLDLRIDKKYPFRKFNLNVFLDVQNITNNLYQQEPLLVLDRTSGGLPQNDPSDPNRYKTKLVKDPGGTILPSIGIIFEL